MALCPKSKAQSNNVFLAVFGNTNAIPLNTPFTYFLFVTNNATLSLQNVTVSNHLPASLNILSATNLTNPGNITTNGNDVVFFITQILPGTIGEMNLTVRSTAVGTITNVVTLSTPQLLGTNLVVEAFSHITNSQQADLAVSISDPPTDVFVGDWITYNVIVTNLGPTSVSSVTVSNRFPLSST